MDIWIICAGLGMLWHGALIIWVGGLPRAFQRGEKPTAPKGTQAAFMIFWLDQYSWIGLCLAISGAVIAALGSFA